jgi:HD-like signal output (HDOD) protein
MPLLPHKRVIILPTIPEVPTQVLRLLRRNAIANASEIVELIRNDAAFAAQVVRRANSSSQPGRQPIHDLDAAVMMLGFGQIRAIALYLSMTSMFKDAGSGFDIHAHWVAAAATAQVAVRIAPVHEVDPADAFLFGLLRSAGRIMMAHYVPEETRAAMELARARRICFHQAYDALHQTTDAVWCAWLLRQWQFAIDLVQAVEHQYDLAMPPGPTARLVAAGQLAEALCAEQGAASPGDFAPPIAAGMAWLPIGYQTDQHRRYGEAAKADIQEAKILVESLTKG